MGEADVWDVFGATGMMGGGRDLQKEHKAGRDGRQEKEINKELVPKYKIGKPLWRFLKELKIEISTDPAITILGFPKESSYYMDTCRAMLIAAQLTIAKI